ncbi:MAG: hypothetical protein AABZ57_08875, partial [Candidatus Margulisiibacteriota bacterium]
GFAWDPIQGLFSGATPFLAVYGGSEEPTPEEMGTIEKIVKKLADGWNSSLVKDFTAEGANTVTLKKQDGRWTFRRMTWRVGPTWHNSPGTLEEIAPKL